MNFRFTVQASGFWEFWEQAEKVASSPHALRIVRTIIYMLYMIHLKGCAYYILSAYEGIGSNSWTYDGEGSA